MWYILLLFTCVPVNSDCFCQSTFLIELIANFQWDYITYVNQNEDCQLQKNVFGNVTTSGKHFLIMDASGNDSWIYNSLNQHKNFIMTYSTFTKNILVQSNRQNLIQNQTFAIFISEDSQLEEIQKINPPLNLFIDSMLITIKISNCEAEIHSLYRIGPKWTNFIVTKHGSWNNFGFQKPYVYENTLAKRGDFMGYPMVGIGVRVFKHFTTYLPDGNITGFVGDIINILKESHNFTLTYRVLPGYAYGKVVGDTRNNKWNGMVGQLQEGNVDFTISELSVTRERSEIVSYTQPLYMISRKMYVATREDMRKKLLTYTSPMDSMLYITTCCVLLLLVLAMAVTSYIFQVLTLNKMKADVTLSEAAWFMISAFLQQGSPQQPFHISCRMIYWYGCMLSVLVYVSYSATLVSHLAVILPTTLPFNDFYGLVKQSNWDAGNVKDDLFEVTASQTCASETHREECKILYDVWNTNVMKSTDNLVTTYMEGLQRSINRNYVFIGVDASTNNYIKQLPQKDACLIRELPMKYLVGGIAIGMQYRSPFLTSFDNSLQKLREMGVMDKLIHKWLKIAVTCETSQQSAADIIDTASLFVLLLIGIFFSLIFFVLEKMLKPLDW